MKVVYYEDSIISKIQKINAEAKIDNKIIRKIILTKQEWYALGEEIKDPRWKYHHCYLGNAATIDGITVECEA